MKNLIARLLFILLALTTLSSVSHAQPQTFMGVTAQVSDAHTTTPAGIGSHLVWHFNMQGDWHVYWQNPGDVGLPYELSWNLPTGWNIGNINWPSPKPFATPTNDPLVMSYGYAKQVALAAPITIPAHTPNGSYPITLNAQFLICEDICLPISATFTTHITVGDTLVVNDDIQKILKQQSYPQPLNGTATVDVHASTMLLTLPSGVKPKHFIPNTEGLIDDLRPQRPQGNTLTLIRDAWVDTPPTTFGGVLITTTGETLIIPERAIPNVNIVEAPVLELKNDHADAVLTFKIALFFAFIAGLVLNVMPCVLPVLMLKIMSLFKHKESRMAHALAYTAGVLACFAGLGLLLISLRQAGLALGWGFHLQSPTFVMVMVLLLLGVAYSLWKTIPFPALFGPLLGKVEQGHTKRGSFGLGVLITLVATPCSVPFMGGAITYALTAPAPNTLAIMLAMGLGMAAPFVLAALLPAPPRLKTKKVAWIKPVLAIPVLLTAVWLFTVWLTLVGVTQVKTTQGWQTWDDTAIATALQEDKTVFLNVTADWCLTCKITEKRVFKSPAFLEWVANTNTHLIEADWTRQNDDVTRLLQSYNREGVPLYVLILPDGQERILPQLPTLADFK